MDVDVEANASESKADGEEVAASPKLIEAQCEELDEEVPTYTSIEAPPSVWPQRHYCDITGLEVTCLRTITLKLPHIRLLQAPYTDPATGLRFYDKSIYEIVKGLSTSTAKEYLSARGVNTIVK
ncbi:hypothetical protein AMATHDRAFT_50112 [Amanita thiersii Skay4041]|uniref:Vps72/YL1 C-terminal domain-containing protein n=1 Tax=Amanita thiersii Skay4041 TaxID=703135 RepID=A0A2A9NIV9_9AGAR|nr:hypothetical protein AMATHDRAFT_50112 [Amanita thiersii Skay4041]